MGPDGCGVCSALPGEKCQSLSPSTKDMSANRYIKVQLHPPRCQGLAGLAVFSLPSSFPPCRLPALPCPAPVSLPPRRPTSQQIWGPGRRRAAQHPRASCGPTPPTPRRRHWLSGGGEAWTWILLGEVLLPEDSCVPCRVGQGMCHPGLPCDEATLLPLSGSSAGPLHSSVRVLLAES